MLIAGFILGFLLFNFFLIKLITINIELGMFIIDVIVNETEKWSFSFGFTGIFIVLSGSTGIVLMAYCGIRLLFNI